MNVLDKFIKNRREKNTKIGLLATAATTGVTVAKFFGKRSVYGIVGGIAVTLAAEYIRKRYEKKLNANQ
ncbi:hypothetical protein [Empedobacter stercoris]|mgnify:FL=1|uniref:Phage protein n=1 Tax=Empedobacter stercoris TaxID=1628248 RepID=A0ABX1WK43_9FLAO|nr:hypothetical protein [Empedobacter stercoris]HJD87482.1 hypothetical protein [Empedobacter falsenii]MCA4776594.1 hypothetical protein [Empedobacter stercoris]MCA4781237.1 hypothetical protein [Empedobacter stercoris]MCA4809739.1 hypothetical protein [Empedobacter stercoris]NOJ74908.1 hypothetical protein [Empedobacter stercoris]